MIFNGTNTPDSISGTGTGDLIRGWDPANPFGDQGPVTDADTLRGADGSDTLWGGNGDDQLFGDAGNDLLVGGDGANFLDGGIGDDRIDSGFGPSTLLGGAGNDDLSVFSWPEAISVTLDGGTGNDTIHARALSNSVVVGGDGIDFLELSPNHEGSVLRLSIADPAVEQVLADGTRILGFEQLDYDGYNTDRDIITGGNLADTIDTDDGRDVIRGLGGNDFLTVGGFDASVYGGAGDDYIRGSIYSGQTWSEQTFAGGTGNDVLQLDRRGVSVSYDFSLADPNIELILADGTHILGIEGIEFWSGEGNDTITGGMLADTLYGGAGDDVLLGGAGDDEISGGIGTDFLSGGDGNDKIHGGSGHGTVLGGAGNDTHIIDFEDNGHRRILGGSGQDLLLLFGQYSSAAYSLTLTDPTAPQITPYGTRFRGIEVIDFSGSAFADDITGGAFDDTLHGDGGDDTLRGGGGNDQFELWTNEGAARLHGNRGIDTLDLITIHSDAGQILSLADPALVQHLTDGSRFSGIEVLSFSGSDSADQVTGGAYDDSLSGGGGSDTLSGGGGNDVLATWDGGATLLGGEGDDHLDGKGGAGTLFDGGAGVDLLDLIRNYAATSGYVLTLADPTATQVLSDGTTLTGIEQIFLGGTAFADHVTGGDLDDHLSGNGGRDTLIGAGGNDTLLGWADALHLHGGSGDDFLSGSSGNDHLFAGSGNDHLSGAEGDDLLSGGAGFDVLSGWDGADRFLFNLAPTTDNIDWIGDFTSGTDQIVLLAQAFGNPAYDQLPNGAFVLGTVATDRTDRILYDTVSGMLWFDADGTGAQIPVPILVLAALTDLAAADIQFI